ncbi:MAG: hypothetical protein O7C59_01580, partial [Rickettsia endosymbiont of Ixodes persulcatus]|nr:hypothetical protein [Rickettsia endosymbiont of Ixodes persulcatus]
MKKDAQLPASVAEILTEVGEATKRIDTEVKTEAYLGAIGQFKGGDTRALMANLNNWTKYGWGWEKPPMISPSLAARLGVSRLPGMNIGYSDTGGDSGGERDGGRGFSSGGGGGRGFGR